MAFKPIEILINAKDNASAVFSSVRGGLSAVGEAANSLAGRLAAAFTIGSLANSAAEMETLQAGLQAVSGSAEKAGQDMDFVRRMAGAAGVDVVEAGRAFLSLSAATKGTAVEGEATRAVFEAVTISMARAGKGSAETSNALQALAQMAGKGQVQMEELRGQLGEALPGALSAAASGLGITTKELSDLVEQGKITAQDLFPALTKGLNDLYGAAGGAQTLTQELVNVKNAFTDMASNIGNAGGLSLLTRAAEIAQMGLVLLDDTLVRTGKSIGVLMAALVSMDFSGLKQSFADIEAEGRDKLLKAAAHNETLRNSLSLTGDEALKVALAQQQAGAAALQAGQQAAVASDQWIKLNSGYGQVLSSVREQIAEQEKSVLAREAEGKASVALASAFGTEAEKRDAQVQAAAANSEALQQLAQLRQTELVVLKAQVEALEKEAAERGKLSAERSKQLEELRKQIGLRQQDADKAGAQAQAARLVAEQTKAQSEALRDNSGRVVQLREEWERTRAELARVRAEQKDGKATLEQVTEAELAAGRAATVYRDAIKDQLRAIEAKRDLQRADLDVQAATVQLAIEQQRAIYEVAKARGDERTATAAQNEIRRLEIELLQLSAEAKRAEAAAAIATAQAKKAELVAAGEYVGAKRLEIEAAIKAAEVKRLEGDIAETTANKLRDLTNAQNQLKGATDSTTNSIQQQSSALNKLAGSGGGGGGGKGLFDEGRKSSRGEELGKGVEEIGSSGSNFRNKDGMTSDAKGNVQQQFVWTRSAIIDYLTQAGLEDVVAEELSKQFLNAQGGVDYEASSAQKRWAGKYGTLAEALGKVAEYSKYDEAGKIQAQDIVDRAKRDKEIRDRQRNPNAPAPSPTPAPAPGPGTGTGGNTYINNITINGVGDWGMVRGQTRHTDADSAKTEIDLLRSLAQARGAAIQ